ncbi:ABC transporter permease [uncultured Serinicoccus sp.]|uniref:FtsX-like permease family protein n=1 Tax=uncultured Serinicoccus sp. TaxID=735514 RepID=UPI002629B73D|nr:ABC transporter permease [uncultured Serinicoccus sp.]
MTWASFARARARSSRGLLLTLLALVTVTTAIIEGTVGYSAAAASTAARGALTEGEPTETGVQVQTRLAEDPGRQDELARRTITGAFAPAPVSIGRLVVTEPQPVGVDGTDADGELVLVGGPELAPGEPPRELVTVLEGAWPSTPGADAPGAGEEAPARGALHVGAAQALDVSVGDTVVVDDRAVEVTALWQPVDPADAFWFGEELVRTGVTEEGTLGPLVVDETLAQELGAPFVRWPVRPDVDRITPEDLGVLATGAESLRSDLRDADGVAVRGVQVEGDLAPTAGQASTNLATARALGVVPLSVLVLVTGLAVTQLARLLAATREPQAQLLVARGASRRQVLLSGLVESVLVALLGAGLGTLGAWAVMQAVPGGEGLLGRLVVTALLTLAGITLALWVVAVLQARRLSGGAAVADRSGRVRAATTLAAVVLVLGAAALSWWQLRRAGSPVTRAEDGTLGTDLVAGAAPALLLAAAAVLATALLGPLSRLLELATGPTRAATQHLAAAQVSRRLQVYAVPVVLVVLAAGSTTLAALFSGTSAQLRDDLAAVREGAPLRADLVRPPATVEPGLVPEPPPDLAALPQVDAAALVWSDPDARVGDVDVLLTLAPTGTDDGGLGAVANVPQGIPAGLVPAGLDRAVDADGEPLPDSAVTVPEGADEVTAELVVERGTDAWELARLEQLPAAQESLVQGLEAVGWDPAQDEAGGDVFRYYLDDSPDAIRRSLESEVAAAAAPVELRVTLLVEDVATGLTSPVTSEPVQADGPRLDHDRQALGDWTSTPARTTADLRFDLPDGREHRVRSVTVSTPGTTDDVPPDLFSGYSSTTLDLDLGLTAGGEELLTGTDGWGSTAAMDRDQVAPLLEEAEAVEDPTFETVIEVDQRYVGEGLPRVSWEESSHEVDVPPWVDTTAPTWRLQVPDLQQEPFEIGVSPGVTYRGGPVLGQPAGTPTTEDEPPAAAVPVALTRQAASAAALTVGDPVTLRLVGTTVPAVVTHVVAALPGQQGETAALADSRVASRVLAEQQRSLTWPDEVWASPSAGVQAAVEALTARGDLRAVTGPGTVSVTDATSAARLVFWVASAGAVLLALTGVAAVAATLLAARRPEVAVLRALGMPPAAQARSRALELAGVVLVAAVFGLAAGWLVGGAVVPELASSTTAPGRLRLPAALRLEALPWAALLAVTLATAGLLTALVAGRVRAQALDRGYREEIR